MKQPLLLITFCCFSLLANAAPRISNVKGSTENNATLVINGQGFGSHASINNVWFLGGKNGWIENSAVGTDPVTAPGTIRIYGSQGKLDRVTDKDKWSGSKSINLEVNPSNPSSNGAWASTWAYHYQPGFRKIFVSFWYKFQMVRFPSPGKSDPQHKFIGITRSGYDQCPQGADPLRSTNLWYWGYNINESMNFTHTPHIENFAWVGCPVPAGLDGPFTWYAFDYVFYNVRGIGYSYPPHGAAGMKSLAPYRETMRGAIDTTGLAARYNFDFGRWNRIDVTYDLGTRGNFDGRLKIRVLKPDGPYAGQQTGIDAEKILFYSDKPSATLPGGCSRCKPDLRDAFVWYNLFDRTSGGGGDQIVNNFIDDPYAQVETEARVEIGNNPDYEKATKLELQKPLSWSDTAVSVTLNYGGSFKGGDSAYLYVIDANGTASPGIPLTLGHADTLPPAAPGNLRKS
ncbi:MAG: hypothetical protein D6719_12035 [Candidatus Dadabacteria bacterium]|nr:MAG: hypothetical protein D6719_12035 [Candidatus Dadabacteria bacterium]